MTTEIKSAPFARVLLPREISVLEPPHAAEVHHLAGDTMATTWSVRVAAPPGIDLQDLKLRVEQVLGTVIAQMSPWEASSDISRFNQAPAGHWQSLPREFAHVMRCALAVASRSGGAFDPAAGAAVNAWGFGTAIRFDDPQFAPPAAPVPARNTRDCARLRLEGDDRLLQPGGAVLNLSAIAKGYAVDAVCALLAERGLSHHLVEIGGELRGSGVKPDRQPWWVDVEPPGRTDLTLPVTRVALHGLAIATSGDYRRYVTVNDRRLQHTIDPRTQQPVMHGVASVTVIHESCMWADAWATALMVLGDDAGLRLAEAERIAVMFRRPGADGTWTETMSSAFSAMAQ